LGDYHDLSRYKDGMFDIVFEVEALCYSTRKERVLSEVNRVLRKGGLFILFDGYLNKDEDEVSATEAVARGLVEKGMALNRFENYKAFITKAIQAGYQVAYEENLSSYVLPTMDRFEKLGARFFKHAYISRLVSKLFPKEFINNAATGYLMPTVMKSGLFCYMLTVLEKI
jgi:SAM-dependent methyltransferase